MPIPEQVQKLLESEHISYGITGHEQIMRPANTLPPNVAVSVVLEDNEGKLQLIFPHDHLIDLNTLNERLGRNLTAIAPENLQHILQSQGVDALPGIPQLTGFPTIVDDRLFDHNELYLESGQLGHFIKIRMADFKQILQNATPMQVTEKIPNRPLTTDTNTDVKELTLAVENFTSLRIKQRLEQTIEIPPLPETAQRIIQLRVDPNAAVKDLVDIVERDPSLAAQVVSWASSPYYAAPGRVRSIEDAIVRVLGFDLVINLAIGLSLGKALQPPKDHPHGFTPYWHQAAFTATSVESLVRQIPLKKRPELGLSYLCGLLHNFGYLVLAYVFPPYFSLICRHIEANPHINHVDIERHIIGVSRDQIGGWLMQIWDMPEEVCTAIRYQNEAEYSGTHQEYPHLLNITGRLLRQHGIGDAPDEGIIPQLYEYLELNPANAANAVASIVECESEIEQLSQFFKSA
ncbi:HDOD domain-containing protein [Zooshikella marina]|uniref:HDOD domain-containing protein n=1 Tax=Zooshikella ganghwensis TaxID=202772 RepID=A0A4P9VIU2_9GAMM|nr:HDOD domain-containing protein [Zooshikella ganghwensis]MBU2708609.1 HDOD domain-containing protein [Zooshikella ganghwensis]RDH42107.1 HDOD domain-containing protein [Zooshikella ganghwensis]